MTDGWQDISSAPLDGRWIIIEGEMSGGDTSTARIARWNPKTFNGIEYEWQTICNHQDGGYNGMPISIEHIWNWYSAGRVHNWMPLP
jgi:hypothetical protein